MPWRSSLVIVLFVTAGFAATGVLPVGEFLARGERVEAAWIELEELRSVNAELDADLQALYTEQEVERIAREQYGFVRPGEIGYVVIVLEGEAPEIAPAVPVATGTEERSFFQRVWDFITGNDLTNDG